MIALSFFGVMAAVFFAIIAIEGRGQDPLQLQRPLGLMAWITSGNWPAKIGGALIVVGVGALLRFALVNFEAPPDVKLSGGVLLVFVLGLAAALLPENSNKRPVSLALGGAAFGVAYLTAYSAFAVFHYLSNPVGLALLALTSVGASVFAITRSALSLAILSMLGAFLAPVFAVTDPGPVVVYGYYLAASLITLVMVALRGWHPLIHLSFLFTLIGGVFFAWSAKYYGPANADVMLPILLLLVTVHVAMPIVEKHPPRSPWFARLDTAYALALPVVAALLALSLAPSRTDLSIELLIFSGIWMLAAAGLYLIPRDGVAVHAVIAGLFVILGVAAQFKNLPWELFSLALSVAGLALAARLRQPVGTLHHILAGSTLLFGAAHVLSTLAAADTIQPFLNAVFMERAAAAALLITAGVICRRIEQALDTLLLAVGILWMVLATGMELVRWELAPAAFVLHWALLLLAASLWIPGRRVRIADTRITTLVVAILISAAWPSAQSLPASVVWFSLLCAPLVLIALAVRPVQADHPYARIEAAVMVPALAGIWAFKANAISHTGDGYFGFCAAAFFAVLTLLVGGSVDKTRRDWLPSAAGIFRNGFAMVLAFCTLLVIARTPWAVTLELLCLAGMVIALRVQHATTPAPSSAVALCVIAAALIVQAHLLRWFGPEGELSIHSLLQVQWPALVSLLWAMLGLVLTVWSQHNASRSVWAAGAGLLVAAAAKLLLVDFGELGQLGNILAVIAAGVVFLLVGWLAPMPPAQAEPDAISPEPEPRSNADVDAEPDTARQFPASAQPASFALPREPEAAPASHAAPTAAAAPSTAAAKPIATAESISRLADAQPASSQRTVRTLGLIVFTILGLSYCKHHQAREMTRFQEQLLAAQAADTLAAQPPQASDPAPSATPPATASTETASEPSAEISSQPSTEPALAAVPEPHAMAEPASTSTPPKNGKAWTESIGPNGVRVYTQTHDDAGQAADQGIEQLFSSGYIRRADRRDIDIWASATGRHDRAALGLNKITRKDGRSYVSRVFIVQKKMTYPANLNTANPVTFIVPHGIPAPYGDPGNSILLVTP